jgi:hypothetical protein
MLLMLNELRVLVFKNLSRKILLLKCLTLFSTRYLCEQLTGTTKPIEMLREQGLNTFIVVFDCHSVCVILARFANVSSLPHS